MAKLAGLVLDIYRSNNKVFVDLNPHVLLSNLDLDIFSLFDDNDELRKKIVFLKTLDYNVAFTVQISDYEPISIKIAGCNYPITTISLNSVNIQLCLVVKDEWDHVRSSIQYYSKVHGVERFIVYDNQSKNPPPDDLTRNSQVIIIEWSIPYLFMISDGNVPNGNPGWYIVAQNSAYSNCLKKYSNAEWTLFLDVDEYLVSRAGHKLVSSLIHWSKYSVIVFPGVWAGCNGLSKNQIPGNLKSINRRSTKLCAPKLLLKTKDHIFTRSIHWAYASPTETFFYKDLQDYFFWHLLTMSQKNRKCNCAEYCAEEDNSLVGMFND